MPLPTTSDNADTPSGDAQLMILVAMGDRAAFERLYHRFSRPLFTLAQSVLRSTAAAEDVRQEVFQEIWKRAAEYRVSLGSPFSWIMTITRHKAIDRLRLEMRRIRHVENLSLEFSRTQAPPQLSAERCVIAQETGTVVRGAVGSLPSDEREAIELAYFEGLSGTEMAQRLHLPLGTVKARVRRGLRHLQRPLTILRG